MDNKINLHSKENLYENKRSEKMFTEFMDSYDRLPKTFDGMKEQIKQFMDEPPLGWENEQNLVWADLSEESRERQLNHMMEEFNREQHELHLEIERKQDIEDRRAEDRRNDPMAWLDQQIEDDQEAYDPAGRFNNEWKFGSD